MPDVRTTGARIAERYEILRVLGMGGMGAVYLVKDTRLLGKSMALKEMYNTFADGREREEAIALFESEMSILVSLEHFNLPRVTDYFSEGDTRFLVMEYVEGRTLEKIVKEGGAPLPFEQVLGYAFQIMDALQYLHSRTPPVIFRDLKPANVIITSQDRVKLIDFGIARLFSHDKDRDTRPLGTPGYAAPEQYGKQQTDARADIFSFGATLYFCLTRDDPEDNPFSFRPLSDFRDDLPADLQEIVTRTVAMDPSQRFQDVAEIRTALSRLAAGGTTNIIGAVTQPFQAAPQGPALRPDPPDLDFGTLQAGGTAVLPLRFVGISDGHVRSGEKWVSVYPSRIKGNNVTCQVTVNTRSLADGGAFSTTLHYKSKDESFGIPVRVAARAAKLTYWSYVLAFIAAVGTLIPIVGLAGLVWLLAIYYSAPRSERGPLRVLVTVSALITSFYALGGLALAIIWWIMQSRGGF